MLKLLEHLKKYMHWSHAACSVAAWHPHPQAKISWCGLCRDLPVTLSSVQRKYSQESIQDNKSRLKGFLKGACKG